MILTPKRPLVQAKDRARLARIIKKAIKEHGTQADLNFIDVSQITDMSGLFERVDFNGDVSQWDVSNVNDMYQMFAYSSFQGDISQWSIGRVTDEIKQWPYFCKGISLMEYHEYWVQRRRLVLIAQEPSLSIPISKLTVL